MQPTPLPQIQLDSRHSPELFFNSARCPQAPLEAVRVGMHVKFGDLTCVVKWSDSLSRKYLARISKATTESKLVSMFESQQ